jgi:hypothetical protein
MGRARRTQSQVVGARSFVSVLGNVRGSVVAQSRRDIEEDAALRAQRAEQALDDFLAEFEIGDNVAGMGLRSLAEVLVAAYREQTPALETEMEVWKGMRASPSNPHYLAFRAVEFILERGDPAECPGLTEPVLAFACSHFEGIGKEPVDEQLRSRYYSILISLFARERKSDRYYQRLAPLSAVLAPFITYSKMDKAVFRDIGLAVIATFEVAPPAALAGSLQPWVEAFAGRLETGRVSRPQRQRLQALVNASAPGSQAATALAPLQAALAAQAGGS